MSRYKPCRHCWSALRKVSLSPFSRLKSCPNIKFVIAILLRLSFCILLLRYKACHHWLWTLSRYWGFVSFCPITDLIIVGHCHCWQMEALFHFVENLNLSSLVVGIFKIEALVAFVHIPHLSSQQTLLRLKCCILLLRYKACHHWWLVLSRLNFCIHFSKYKACHNDIVQIELVITGGQPLTTMVSFECNSNVGEFVSLHVKILCWSCIQILLCPMDSYPSSCFCRNKYNGW